MQKGSAMGKTEASMPAWVDRRFDSAIKDHARAAEFAAISGNGRPALHVWRDAAGMHTRAVSLDEMAISYVAPERFERPFVHMAADGTAHPFVRWLDWESAGLSGLPRWRARPLRPNPIAGSLRLYNSVHIDAEFMCQALHDDFCRRFTFGQPDESHD